MRKKKLHGLLTAIILSVFSCSDKPSSNYKAVTSDNQISSTTSLIGKWTLSRTDNSGVGFLCNVCPTINFDHNIAVLTFPNNRKEHYTWKISYDTLTLLSTNSPTASTLPYFFHLKYKMEYKQETEFSELKLSPDISSTFILRR